MMMPDDLDPVRWFRRAMAVMEMKSSGRPGLDHFHLAAQLPIVISRDDDWLTNVSEALQQLRRLRGRCAVVDQIAQDDEPERPIFLHELGQALGDRRHAPHRHKPAGRALAQFIAEMEVGDRQPAFHLVEKRKPAIEQNIGGDQSLVGTK
jgi:hypothetical protein